MADIALSVASKVAEYLVAPVGRHCGYVIFSDRYVRQLNGEVEKLGAARDEVLRSIDEAQNNMKPIKAKVEKWVKEVETVANKARNVRDDDGRAKKTCFYGWLPNPKARYCLGKEASRTVKDIQELIALGQFEKVDFENPPPGLVGVAPTMSLSAGDGGDTITDSRASIFQDIMKALDDEKLKVIGVYGPGGVGKTTLLEEVEKKLRREGRPFHMIVKAKVSQTPDLNKIQDDIAFFFGLKLKDEPSEVGRRDLLRKRLQKVPSEKILIILDDLWDKLDLKAVGIPLGDESRGCKLLLTSRYKDVLEQKMLADRTFRLEGLNNDEAVKLFEETVGDKLKDEELRRIAPKVVKKLAGLPLLIISVASTLKYSHLSAWNKALRKIDESNIETIVKLSYDHLKSEDAKSLFLLCGLIGGTIQVETLFVLGMGLGLFEGFNKTMQDSRDELNTTLDSLRSICLLQDGGDDKENVTIHDLYSKVVISTPFRGQNSLMMNSNYGSWQKEKLEKCRAICLADIGKDRLTELMMCQFPNLKILMLSQPEDWRWMSEHLHDVEECCGLLDFTDMKELQVLYLRSMHISSLPSSIGILGNLHSLYLGHCDVKDVTILGKLKALQILSFARSAISRLPKEIGELTNLRSLNLSYCSELKTIEAGVLQGLIKLEELCMEGSFDQWMGKDEIPLESCNAKLAELKSLTRLTTLEISIPNPTMLLENGDLPFGNLIRFRIDIGNVDRREFQGLKTMKLKLEGCDGILSKEWVRKTLQKTQYLHLDGLGEFKKNAHESCIRGNTQLKHLDLYNSPSIKYIASSSSDPPTAFTILESLFLKNLINLEKLCNGPVALDCFSKLKAIHTTKCHRLENMWFLSEMQRLVHLEEIQVCECDSLQAIITYDARKGEVAADDIVELPKVRRLALRKLPNMTSFCTGAEGAPIQVSLPCLESLVMVGFLELEKILYSEPSLKYGNLKSLKIKKSKSTSSIVKDWIPKLSNLESMEIVCSPSVEVVFDLEELKVTRDAENLSRLKKLKLSKLPNLQYLWKQDGQLQGISIFQNLKWLIISNTGLTFLFSVSMAKCLREIRDIEVEDCPNMKSVIVDEEGRDDGTDDIIEFPLLERLSIIQCPTEKFFSYPHGKKESIATTSDSQDTYSDSFFDQKISLPSLEELELESVKLSKRIWHHELPKSSVDKLANLTPKQDVKLQGISIFWNLKELSINKTGLTFLFSMSVAKCLREIRDIEVEDCPNMKAVIVDEEERDDGTYDIIEFPLLERLSIIQCPTEKFFSYPHGKKESIATTSDSQDTYSDSFFDQKISLPSLEELELESVRLSERIWHSELPKSSFDKLANQTLKQDVKLQGISIFWNLKELSIHKTGLTFLFSMSVAKCLREIRDIEVEDCPNMKAVIVDEEGRDDGTDDIIEFPLLERLSIIQCPMEKFFSYPHGKKKSIATTSNSQDTYSDSFFDQKVTFPNMEDLYIGGIRCKELWNNQISDDSFCKLKSLKLKGCDNLQCIAPSHMWNRLQRCLETLKVKSCCSIEIIYKSDGMMAKSSNLRMLVLHDLDNLKHIWWYDGVPNIPFPSLRYIKALRCSRLEMLFPTFTAEFLGQIEKLVVGSCEDMELIAGHEECEESTGTTITFSKLTSCSLYNLPKFRSFLPEKFSSKFPLLDRESITEPDQGYQSEEDSEGESEDESSEESDDESSEESDDESEDESYGESEDESKPQSL